MKRRDPTVELDGVVLLDKPEGLSSNAALQRTRRSLRAAKAGHTGTLDPMATGLLPVCLGDATKFSQGLLDADKGYLATARLGLTTTTGDREGEVLAERPVEVSRDAIERVLAGLLGPIEQVPPMFSALKHQGRRLYAIAREGGEVERVARRVHIHRLNLVEWSAPHLVFAVDCSKGTYVRTLAEEIGEQLGTGAHLVALRRTMVGPFRIDEAVSLEDLEAAPPDGRLAYVRPADALVLELPKVTLDAEEALRLLQGRELEPGARAVVRDAPAVGLDAGKSGHPTGHAPASGCLVRLYTRAALPGMRLAAHGRQPAAGRYFIGVGCIDADGSLRTVRLIAHTAVPATLSPAAPGPAVDETA